MNSWKRLPCSHGEHCWAVKAVVSSPLLSGLVFVLTRDDQQKDPLTAQLRYNNGNYRSPACSSPFLQPQLDFAAPFPLWHTQRTSRKRRIYFIEVSFCLASIWTAEAKWKDLSVIRLNVTNFVKFFPSFVLWDKRHFSFVTSSPSPTLCWSKTLIILYSARFSDKQKTTKSLNHLRFVVGIHNSCLHFPDLFLELKLATRCINSFFFFIMFSTADKIIVPHLERTSWLHDWFYYYIVKMFYIDGIVLIEQSLSVFLSVRNVLFVVSFMYWFFLSWIYISFIFTVKICFSMITLFFLFLFCLKSENKCISWIFYEK